MIDLLYFMLVVGLIILVYVYFKLQQYTYFKKLGYSGPKPSLIKFGNLTEFSTKSNSIKNDTCLPHYSKTLYRWSLKYGKIYGYYEFTKPILVISDADLVKNIFIDDEMQHRRSFVMSKKSDEPEADLYLNNGERWLRVRKYLNKIFESKNTRLVSYKHLNESLRCLFTTDLKENKKTSKIDIYEKIKSILVDSMFKLTFGVKLDQHYRLYGNKNELNNRELSEDLVRKFDEGFINFESASVLKICSLLFDEFDAVWRFIHRMHEYLYQKYDFKYFQNPLLWFNKHFTLKQYDISNENNNMNDCLLTMFLSTSSTSPNSLSDDEKISNSTLMTFAGYQTMSTAIAFAYHVMVNNRKERLKLVKELNEHFNNNICPNEDLSIESINKLEYLNLFIKEVLRMYPISNSSQSRKCVKANHYIGENKEYLIPNGIGIAIDVLSIHYNEKLWGPVSPFIFYPNRFKVKRHVCAWLPFGVGSRKCLAMEMALENLKLALIRIIQRYFINQEIDDESEVIIEQNIFNSIETKDILFNVPVDNIVVSI